MTAETTKKIIAMFEEYNLNFKELTTFLTEKQQKVIADDLYWLLSSLTEEQRLIMKGNSLEAKRLRLFDECGVKGYKSQRLIDECPEEYKGKLKVEIAFMEKSVDMIKSLNSSILELIQRKLENQQEIASKTGFAPADTYTSTGTKISTHGTGVIIGEV